MSALGIQVPRSLSFFIVLGGEKNLLEVLQQNKIRVKSFTHTISPND